MSKTVALLMALALALFLLVALLALPVTAQEGKSIAAPAVEYPLAEEWEQEAETALAPAATHVYTDDTGLTSINSYSCTAAAVLTINVPDDFVVGDVDVGINISHTWRGDVSATLYSPAGTSVMIVSDPILADENANYDVRVDDVSPNLPDDGGDDDIGAPYYDRTIAPTIPFFNGGSGGGLESFESESAQGDWRLLLCDQFSEEDDGNLIQWTLFFREPAPELDYYVVAGAPYSIEPGQVFSYAILVWNTGGAVAASTLISDALPSGVTQSGPATIQLNDGASTVGFQSTDPITWLGSIQPSPPYGRMVIAVPVVATAGAGDAIVNSVIITDPALDTETTRLAETRVYSSSTLHYYEGFNAWASSTGDPDPGPGSEWDLNGEWEFATLPSAGPLIGPAIPHSGLAVVGTNPTGPYDDSVTSVMTAVLDLTAAPLTGTMELRWWEWLDTREAADEAFVQIASAVIPTPRLLYGQTNNGLTEEQIAHERTWFEVVQDITPYQGQVITLAFTLQPNGDALTAAGWYVDDVSVHVSPNRPAFTGSWKDVTPTGVWRGDMLTYTIYITNSGLAASTNGHMLDQLPPGLSVADVSIDGDGILTAGGDWVEWQTAPGQGLLSGEDVTITIAAVVQADAECGATLSNATLVTDSVALDDVPIAAGPVLVYQDVYHTWDLESNDGGFVGAGYITNTWAWGDLVTSTNAPPFAHSGTRLWATNLSGNIPAGPGAYLLTKTVTLPTDLTGVYLEWWDWWDGEGMDAGHVYVNTAAHTLYSIDADQHVWDHHAVNLTPWAGQTVDVVFYYDADSGSGAGWYVDDVSIHDGCPYVSIGPDQTGGACQGSTAVYTLTVRNVSDDADVIEPSVSWDIYATDVSSPLSLGAGETGTFTVSVDVPLGTTDFVIGTAQVTAQATTTSMSDTATLTTTSGPHWVLEAPLPAVRTEHALVEYNGESYLLSGHDGAGNPITPTLKYSPTVGTWTPLAPEPTPEIRAANDACVGQNSAGDPVIVLFPEPTYGPLTDTLHVYNISSDSWVTLTMLAPLPAGGLWGLDIVSDRDNNICYISGGRDMTGIVRNTLYAYDVDANTATNLPPMTTARLHHASWLYDGKVCVGGGTTDGIGGVDSTQCYDIAGGTWLGENATLGSLPYAAVGMMDAEKWVGEVQQLWIVGGSESGILTPHSKTAHWDSDTAVWTLDAPLPVPILFGGGDTQVGDVYVVGGTTAGSTSVVYHQHHVLCYEEPSPAGASIYLPVVLRNYQ